MLNVEKEEMYNDRIYGRIYEEREREGEKKRERGKIGWTIEKEEDL